MPFSSEYPFLDVHRSNALESNLMSVYVIRSYVHIASTSKHVVTKKNCGYIFFLNMRHLRKHVTPKISYRSAEVVVFQS